MGKKIHRKEGRKRAEKPQIFMKKNEAGSPTIRGLFIIKTSKLKKHNLQVTCWALKKVGSPQKKII